MFEKKAKESILDSIWQEEDPLSGMANLFDVGIVFSIALILALMQFYQNQPPQRFLYRSSSQNVPLERIPLKKFRMGSKNLIGEGEKLGVCYRLKNGEIIYIPE
ncbi:MAG: DUF2149 domain-containing protein [Planctomycetota bacterium]|nr:MAG: DUF2149 domain-containing protein [Planctomycetota bacterium]